MFHLIADRIHENVTVGELPLYDVTVFGSDPTSELSDLFQHHESLPAIAVIDRSSGDLLGLVTRAHILDLLSRRFGQELHLKKPVEQLLKSLEAPIVLNWDTGVHAAAREALSRAPEKVFEPVVVRSEKGSYGVLDTRVMLTAQSGLLELAAQTIQRQKDVAEAASRSKSEFLANMSHEIRTPLTAILGFSEELLQERLDYEQQVEIVETVLRNGAHLLQLINDLLDLSKIEAGQVELETLPTELPQLLGDILNLLDVRASKQGLNLSGQFIDSIPRVVSCDPTRLRQILVNLLGNAIKFTETGSVTLEVRLRKTNDNSGQLALDVIDTGIGMSEQQLAKLFQPFTQADGSTTRKYGGTGLGLSISRRLARMMGGDVQVVSQLGSGCRFTTTVHVTWDDPSEWVKANSEIGRSGQTSKQFAGVTEQIPPCQILLAEDSPDNQVLLSRILKRAGACLHVVSNGRLAVDAVLSEPDRFDIVLMDMQMPVLDGYSATRELRSRGWRGPIVALTANAMKGDSERCIEAGCDEYATKPIVRQHLFSVIRRLLDGLKDTNSEVRKLHDQESTHEPALPDTISGSPAIVNWQTALQRCGDDADLLEEIIDIFLKSLPQQFRDLQSAWESEDQETATRIVHTLKNAADNLGATLAWKYALEFEQQLHQICPFPFREQRGYLEELESRFLTTVQVLQSRESPQHASTG